jgi:hypothetical protein
MTGSKPIILYMAIALGMVACPAFAAASDTFRCPGGAIIAVHDRLSAIASKCDAPTYISRRTITRGLPSGYFETIELEEWTYNLGSSRFIYYLTFENGFLERIESGTYGD